MLGHVSLPDFELLNLLFMLGDEGAVLLLKVGYVATVARRHLDDALNLQPQSVNHLLTVHQL